MKLKNTSILLLLSAVCTFSFAKYPITLQQKNLANSSQQKGISLKYIKKNAPSHYIVKSGDTLWEIAGKFLIKPFLWPSLWGINKDKIINPHLIYPGQHLYLIKKNGYAYLSTNQNGNLDTIKLRPKIRTQESEQAIPIIPDQVIKAFAAQSKILDKNQVDNALKLIGGEPPNKINFSKNDIVYLKSTELSLDKMSVFKSPKPIYNPSIDKKSKDNILGYESEFAGDLIKVNQNDQTAVYKVENSIKEIEIGDLAMQYEIKPNYNIAPMPAPKELQAIIAKIYGGNEYGSKGFVIAINKGNNQNIKQGYVFKITKPHRIIEDKTSSQKLKIPNLDIGYALVFAVYDNISYAFISDNSDAITTGDILIGEE